ncbi:MAG: C39 family peptidase [Candidatus Methanoperedens sp.]|nr:C39 family peptidase [Candidatus Methanoperedens sp.]MCE8427487.1 C39 family peptidase [Candidatus Methanoperedens sp.]
MIKIEKRNLQAKTLLILIFFYFIVTTVNAASSSFPPEAYRINEVPQHKQMNALLCGPGSLEIIFDFWGPDIDQKAIADVARSSSKGTNTWDMARTGHFSYLSAANGSYFSHYAPTAGFQQRQIGYASFNYSSETPWWNALKALVASNIPVLLLMKYAPDDDNGHYRVIVGYDETKEVVYFIDPWDRDLGHVKNPDGTVTWTMADFKKAWNYSKYGAPHPYWGAVMMPWSIDLKTDGPTSAGSEFNVSANITYPCPQPFDCTAFPASNTSAVIILSGMDLAEGAASQINIGDLKAGESNVVTWKVHIDHSDVSDPSIMVKAEGLVSGTVPDVIWPGIFYPAYEYTDKIGGEAGKIFH